MGTDRHHGLRPRSQRSGTRHVDRIWQIARPSPFAFIGDWDRRGDCMLLSFERPARRRSSLDKVPGYAWRVSLFADLENCTVANDTGITGQSRKALPRSPSR